MKPATELINKAIAEAKAGNIAGARTNLAQVVRKEPENVQAWYLLSRVVEDKEQIIYCLKRVLQIMPDSPQAKARLKKLQAGPTTHASIPTQTQRKIRPGLIVLIGSAGLIESGLLLIAVFWGVNALRSLLLPIPTTLSQALVLKDPGTKPALVFPYTPELKPTEPIPLLPTSTATFPSTPLPSPIPTNTTRPHLPGAAACIPPEAQIEVGDVTRVIDGDTIEVSLNGQIYKVRYIGIDTPEINDPQAGTEFFGPEAAEINKGLVEGKEIILVKDVSETDQYGRLLRYILVGDLSGVFVNYELAASGYARADTFSPDVACAETFLSAEQNARSNEYGLWAPIPIPLPTESRSVGDGGNCDPAYPEVCIPPPPPDLDCKDIQFRRFRVLQPDPHHFDGDKDGIGCER